MLVLTRKAGQRIVIGDITVHIAEIRHNRIRVAIDAPRDIPILRAELAEPVYEEIPYESSDGELLAVR